MDDILKRYAADVLRTENPDLQNPLAWAVMKLAEEAGEACGLVAKRIGQGHDLRNNELALELGDALYFLVYAGLLIGYSLEDIIKCNIAKRREIYPNGFDPARSRNREAMKKWE